MAKRKAYAPFSLTSEAGVAQTPVEGYIDVDQTIYPVVSTGTVNENGKWTGVKSDDVEFFGLTTHVAVGNGGDTLNPADGTINFLDMTGFNDIFIAIKPSRGGNMAIKAIMGPDTNRFANLTPVNSGTPLRGNRAGTQVASDLLFDTAEALTADVWNIFFIGQNLKGQKNMQFMITNNTGVEVETLEVGFMRLV